MQAHAPVKSPANVSAMVRLPDGTYMPTLNGVENPPPLPWPQNRPWSPIIGRERGGDGLEWFVHADGVKTQLRMLYRTDIRREDKSWIVAEPAQPKPIADQHKTGQPVPAMKSDAGQRPDAPVR